MKIICFADLHMCPKASIVNKWGAKYPIRLENCINSVNWLERLAEWLDCDYIVNLGDFFDKPDLSSETITACNEISWSNIMHYSIVGNHEASTSTLVFNSVNTLFGTNHTIITEPTVLTLPDCFICFLPYVVECDRKPIKEYFPEVMNTDKPVIILSHNDISGIQLGPVVSRTGFSLEEIEEACQLFINGHLHNGQQITPKVINLGNFSGKDFGEDAFRYSHNVLVLDTETLEVSYIENPYAFNFYKIQIDSEADLQVLNSIKSNAVVSVKCDVSVLMATKQAIAANDNIVDSRIIITHAVGDGSDAVVSDLDLSVDHLARFIECCKAAIENSSILDEEISEICK